MADGGMVDGGGAVGGEAGRERIVGAESIWELLERRADRSFDRTALRDEHGRSLSFGELRRQADALADTLGGLGFERGQVVSWQLPTRLSTVVLSAALCRIGAVQNPIILQYRERELESVLRRCRSAVLVVPDAPVRGVDYVALAREVRRRTGGELWIVTLSEDGRLQPAEGEPERPPQPTPSGAGDAGGSDATSGDAGGTDRVVGDARTSWIYCTSGTTAEPKGVRHSDRSMIAGTEGWVERVGFSEDDVAGVAFPWAHAGGTMYLAVALISGGGIVLLEQFDPPRAVAMFAATGTTVVGGSTVFYQAFLDEQRRQPGSPIIPSLRMMTGGAAPMPSGTFYQVAAEIGVRILHGYGSTEAPAITVGSLGDDDQDLADTVGRPVAGLTVKVVRTDGTTARADEDGELLLRGPQLLLGYTDPVLDAESWTDDGYFRTGDIGHLRPDGRLVVTGRVKDIIIRKGENVSAREVEEILATHPKVVAAAVVGLPDEVLGERVCAVVEVADPADPLSTDEMVDHFVGAGAMRQKIPERLEVVEAMPRGGTYGKIDKKQLRAWFS